MHGFVPFVPFVRFLGGCGERQTWGKVVRWGWVELREGWIKGWLGVYGRFSCARSHSVRPSRLAGEGGWGRGAFGSRVYYSANAPLRAPS